jgi:hypothetical protein
VAVPPDNLPLVAHRVVYVTILALGVLLLGGSAAAQSAPAASSSAYGVRVVLPGGTGKSAAAVSAPPRGGITLNGFGYGDGAVSTGGLSTAARTSVSSSATAGGSATIRSVSLFGGEITADAVVVRANARASGNGAAGSLDGSSVSSLVALGSPVQASGNRRVALGDWGYMIVLEQAVAARLPRLRDGAPRRPHGRARRPAGRDGDHGGLLGGGGKRPEGGSSAASAVPADAASAQQAARPGPAA